MQINLRDKDNDIVELRKLLERRLARYGLKPYIETWEVHGSHGADMPYPVYIGDVYEARSSKRERFTVVIKSRAIYVLAPGREWYNVRPEDRLEIE